MKRFLKITAAVIGFMAALAVLLVVFLSATEYRPQLSQPADISYVITSEKLDINDTITVLSWNIGYGGLGKESDFFMDGGEMVYPPSKEAVVKNIDGITSFIKNGTSDIYLLQEVDKDSFRTDGMDQTEILADLKNFNFSYARNYKCSFVPFPLPPLGRMDSGIMTMSEYTSDEGVRISLPSPFSWPVSTANLKRCLLVNRFPLEGSDNELVVVNLHLEAYDGGDGSAK